MAIDNDDAEDIIIAEGTWELTYTLRYKDASEDFRLKDFCVTDQGGHYYKVKKIVLSPVGIHFDLLFYDPDATNGIFTDFKVSLLLADGTELPLEGGGGGHWTEGDKKADVSYYAEFDIPIPRDDIKAIVICGTTYELNNTD